MFHDFFDSSYRPWAISENPFSIIVVVKNFKLDLRVNNASYTKFHQYRNCK